MSLSKAILSYISEANKFEKWFRNTVQQSKLSLASNIIDRAIATNNQQILRRKEVRHPFVYSDQLLQKKNAGIAKYNSNRINALNAEFRDAMNAPRSNNDSNSKGSSFWSKAGNHKVGYGVGAGAVTAAGIGAAVHHHNKNKGILNKIKNNPGKAAGASLAALGAGAGAAALIRYLRKKKKQGK